MPINASIIGGLRSPRITVPDPEQEYSNAIKLKGLMGQQQDQDQARADDMAVRDAYKASAGDQNAVLKALASDGQYKAANAIQKQILDAEKARADVGHINAQTGQANATAAKTVQETQFAAAAQHAQKLALIRTPEDVAAYAKEGEDLKLFPPGTAAKMVSIAQSFPTIDAWKEHQQQGSVPVLKRYEIAAENSRNAATNQTSRDNNTATNLTSRQNNSATVGATIRGQNMTDARSRETIAATVGKPFEVTGPDGNPVLVQQSKDGTITPVQGYSPKTAADKPLTEGQAKALGFGSRMREADKVLEQLLSEGTQNSIPGSRAPIIGGAISALSSGNRQMLDQAKRDFMTAILRRESGASISSGEFDTADKQYFPQIGDTDATIEQKAANRKMAIDGVLIEVPQKQRDSLQPRAGASGKFPVAAKTKAGATVSNW